MMNLAQNVKITRVLNAVVWRSACRMFALSGREAPKPYTKQEEASRCG